MSVKWGRNSLFKAFLIASTVIVPVGPVLAQSQAARSTQNTQSFNIPAQPLSSALTAFARQSGIRLAYPASLAAGKSAPAIQGSFRSADVIGRLLAGSGLSYRFTSGNAVTIFDPAASAGANQPPINDGSIVLDTIDVTSGRASGAGYMGTPDWVYQTPASVSVISREAIQNSGARDTRDLLNLPAGVYSGEGQGSFPTVSPNIRGLQDSGRVVVSIDGARQNAQDGGRYGSSGLANFGGAFVDTAFTREIDINKNPGAAAGSAGSLGGTVNFRSVGADDLIKPGKNWGMETNLTRGTNEHNFQGSVLAATRIGENLSFTAGLSRLRLGEYRPGMRGESGGIGIYDLTNRDSWSSFLKLEGKFGDLKTSLSWMHQQNDFAYSPTGDDLTNRFDARNDSAVADFTWDPPSPLINLKGKFWYNDNMVHETRDMRVNELGRVLAPETYIDKGLRSFGGTLENTSELQTGAGPLTFNYGVEAFRDQADRTVNSSTIAQNPLYASGYGSFNPPGQRDVTSAFLNGKWEPASWVNVSGGVRYDWYRLKGRPTYYSEQSETIGIPSRLANAVVPYGPWAQVSAPTLYSFWMGRCTNMSLPAAQRQAACDRLTMLGEVVGNQFYFANSWIPGTQQTITTYPAHEVEIDRSGGAWLPAVTVEFKPIEWFRPYASYSHSFRPPTITEAFIGGALAPGDGVGLDLAPNPNLRPETARTTEIGVNVLQNGLFSDGDRLRIKAAAFHREIDDYIVMGYIQTAQVTDRQYLSFVNADGITTMHGVELEGNYDAGSFWISSAATWLKTQWPEKTEVFNNGSGTATSGEIFAVSGNVPPKFKLTVDGGVRLFDQWISIGARVNHVMPTMSRTIDAEGNLTELTEPYTTVDIHSSIKLGELATLRLFANNITDRKYVPATGNYIAPGRTFMATINMKFPLSD